MNPVVSYYDFLRFMRSFANGRDRLVPVLLIKPATVRLMNENRKLDYMLDYFDLRSRSDIQFFLPGYSHIPGQVLLDIEPHNRRTVALNLERLHNVYYSNDDFIKFIELLEKRALGFRYYGETELIFIKYLVGIDGERGEFDFNTIHRYNLSQLYYRNERGMDDVHRFLETVIHIIRSINDENRMIDEINVAYGY